MQPSDLMIEDLQVENAALKAQLSQAISAYELAENERRKLEAALVALWNIEEKRLDRKTLELITEVLNAKGKQS